MSLAVPCQPGNGILLRLRRLRLLLRATTFLRRRRSAAVARAPHTEAAITAEGGDSQIDEEEVEVESETERECSVLILAMEPLSLSTMDAKSRGSRDRSQ